jgi:long-chain acyl-CoA synthetase
MNLFSYIERRAQESPGDTGLLAEDGTSWTYAQLNAEAASWAHGWRALGAVPRSRVAIYVDNGPRLAFALLGAWKLGAVAVPINVRYGPAELLHALEAATPTALLADRDREPVLHELASHLPPSAVLSPIASEQSGDYTEFSLGEFADSTFEPNEDDEAVLLLTGGTTGIPKLVRTTHAGWSSTLETLARAARGREGPYAVEAGKPPNLIALPLFHAGGQQAFLFSYVVGRTPLVMHRFDPERLAELVGHYGVDNLFLLPTMLHDLAYASVDLRLSSVRAVLVSGQELNLVTRRRFEERFHIPIQQNYGSTEAGHVAGWTGADLRAGLWKPGSAGRIYEGVELQIRDDDENVLSQGETGEICVKSAVAKGYVGAEEQLDVSDGWVHTQDVGYVDADGVLFLVGRKRDLIKCGGFQVWPAEVEGALLSHPLVKEAAIIGVPDERLGERPVGVIVPITPAEDLGFEAEEELIDHCRARLAHYKAVREVRFVDALPRSHAGKLDRSALLALAAELPNRKRPRTREKA